MFLIFAFIAMFIFDFDENIKQLNTFFMLSIDISVALTGCL